MVNTEVFVSELLQHVKFFSGVPDSLLKEFNSCIIDKCGETNNIIAANEGNAIGLATGYYLATKQIGAVYMQNSGLGNAVNPLISLADSYVYSIPMLLFVGQRGKAGISDEPQHMKQGLITIDLLESCGIPYVNLSHDSEEAVENLKWAVKTCKQILAPVAIVVDKNTFSPYKKMEDKKFGTLHREESIEYILDLIENRCDYKIISTTGMISRELYELRDKHNQSHSKDFLVVGAMGHVSQIALGYARYSDKKIICLDGDGSVIMHMGGLALVGTSSVDNIIHIVLNNSAHDSVGGQPTIADKISFSKIALSCGYDKAWCCKTSEDIQEAVEFSINNTGKFFIEIEVIKGARKDLGRPKLTTKEIKELFMKGE